jgi:hypothetical protein
MKSECKRGAGGIGRNTFACRLNALSRALAWLALALLPATGSAQIAPAGGMLAAEIRGNMAADSAASRRSLALLVEPTAGTRKSGWIAGGLSVILPGAGQYYAEAPLWRTILYGVIEAAGWTAYAVYTSRGNRLTDDFQNFADAHWDVTRYISWISDNYQKWSPGDVDKAAATEALAAIYRSNDPSLPGWQRVDLDQLHKLERAVSGGFSHTLPPHGDQQYYEEIVKYVQYRAGWDDHMSDGDTIIYNPDRVSGRNLEYTADRRDANAVLGYAETAIGVVLLNHVASMIDAALAARTHNISLEAKIIQVDPGTRGVGMEMRVGF